MRIQLIVNSMVLTSLAALATACGPGGPGGPGGSGGPGGPGGPGSGPEQGPPPFSELDPNGDGKLTLEEFKQHKIPHGDHDEVFRMIDANGDGVITQAEFDSHRPPAPPPR